MKKRRYIIEREGYGNFQQGDKFCTSCGNKNIVWLSGLFDGKTGLPMAWYVCGNRECDFSNDYANGCMNGHDYRKDWIFGKERCVKCGRKAPEHSFM